MADGTIVIDTRFDISKLENKLSKLNNDIERQTSKVNNLQLEYDRLNDALNDARAVGAYINPDDVAAAEAVRLRLEQAQIALERMNNDADRVSAELDNARGNAGLMQQNINAARQQLSHFEKRLKGVVKEVLIFTMFAAVLRNVNTYIGEALSTNEDFQASLAKLKGTLQTAFQPILNFVIPILKALINVLSVAMGYIARFTSWLFGTTVSASSAAAKALYEQANATEAAGAAAQKAKRQMSGLDEMNTYQSDSGSGGGGGGNAIKNVDFNPIKNAIGELEIYISGALLALGAILAFTGVSIPFGVALMAIGAAGLASALGVDWNTMPDNIKKALTATLTVLGTAALVIGAILTFSGADLPLGIGLLVTGAAALGTAAALNWDTIKNKLKGEGGKITAAVSVYLLAFGAILAFSGVSLPLGIALIAAGVTGLVTAAAFNWDAILDKLKSVWSSIKNWFKSNVAPKLTLKYWQDKFANIAEGLASKIKGGINAAIALFNRFISWFNDKMNIKWSSVKIAGLEVIPKGSLQLMKLNNIPMLAQGAVIPANHEFLAVLGDQKQGTNIEAPEELIRKIVREETGAGTYTFIAQLDGRTIFKEVIDQGKLSRQRTGKNAFNLGGA